MALVITIIILIILAGVSINLILGDNGIVTKSILAKKEMKDAQELENITLAQYHNEMETHISASNREISNGIVKKTLFEGNLSITGIENAIELSDSWENYDLLLFRTYADRTGCWLDDIISKETIQECYESESCVKVNSDNDGTAFNLAVKDNRNLYLQWVNQRAIREVIGIKF